jgi:hypothetical protein
MKNNCFILAAVVIGLAFTLKLHAADAPVDFPKAGLELWLSAGQVEQAGGTITLIKDLSGNGNDAQREPATAAPVDNPAIVKYLGCNQPALRFSGATIAYPFKQITDIRTVFWVVCKDQASFGARNEKFVLGDKTSNDFHAGWTDDTILNTDVNPGHVAQNLANARAWLNGQSIVANKTPFPKQLSVITLVSTGPVRAGQLAGDRNFGGRSWQGDIAEILIYNVELSDADRQAVEKYLMTKYALKADAATAPAAASAK